MNRQASAVVDPNAIPWFPLAFAGSQSGPTGGDRLAQTTYIQWLNPSGGLASAGTCNPTDPVLNAMLLVPYTADYFFYGAAQHDD